MGRADPPRPSSQAASTLAAAFFGRRSVWTTTGERASAVIALTLAPGNQEVSGSLIPKRIAAWCASCAIRRWANNR
jgi:hypothetical protein